MSLRDAAQQALEVIGWLRLHLQRDHQCLHMDSTGSGIPAWIAKSQTAIRAALAEPQPEIEQLKAERDALQNTKHYEAPRGFVLNPDYLVPELQAQRDAAVAALEMIAGVRPCLDNLMSDKDIARAAIRARGEKNG